MTIPGLANLGNTCFLNSLIQALNAAKPFNQALSNKPPSPLHSPIILHLANILRQLNSQPPSTIRPVALLQALAARHRDYLRKDQQDAHELLHILLHLIRAEEEILLANPQIDQPKHNPIPEADPPTKPSPTLEPTPSTTLISSSSSASSAHSFPLPTSTFSATSSASSTSSIEPPSQPPKHSVPHLDSLFTGRLTQYTVCENLHLSSVPEEFLDLSLATRDTPPTAGLGKRARFRKHLQNRLKGPSTTKLHLALQPAPVAPLPKEQAPRRSSLSDSDRPPPSLAPRRASLDSCRDVNFCSPRLAFWPAAGPSAPEPSPLKIRFGSKASLRLGRPTKDLTPVPPLPLPGVQTHTEAHKNQVRMILAESPKPGPSQLPDAQDTGLHALLRKFTGVEVLEGDNKYECKECSKHASRAAEDRQRASSSKPAPLPRTPTSLFCQSSSSSTHSSATSSLLTSPVVVRGDAGPNSPAFTESSQGEESWEEIPTIRIVARPDIGEAGDEWMAVLEEGPVAKEVQQSAAESTESRPSERGRSSEPQSSEAQSSEAGRSSQSRAPQQQAFGERLRASLRRSTTAINSSSREREPAVQQPVLCRAFKRYLFAELPEVLVVHFKRFEPVWKNPGGGAFFGASGGSKGMHGASWNKVDDVITFPERLDMRPFSDPRILAEEAEEGRRRSHEYRLVSVVVHVGLQVGGGHYVAYVLTGRNGGDDDGSEWVYCSDSETRVVEKKEVLGCQAYMVVYEKLYGKMNHT